MKRSKYCSALWFYFKFAFFNATYGFRYVSHDYLHINAVRLNSQNPLSGEFGASTKIGNAWITPKVGEAARGITILDSETAIPTAANFGGPDPECVYIESRSKENRYSDTDVNASTGTFVDLFRDSAPYFRMHKGAIFVLHISGDIVNGSSFQSIMDDIGLLNLLGIHVVLVAGSNFQRNELMTRANIVPQFHDRTLIIDQDVLKMCKEAAGYVRFEIERSLMHGQLHGNTISISGGNFFSAKPLETRNGIDYGFSGEVRRIDNEKIRSRLLAGDIVQLSSIGFSSSGEVFIVDTLDLAAKTASHLDADKIIFLSEGQKMINQKSRSIIRTLRLREARSILTFLEQKYEKAYIKNDCSSNSAYSCENKMIELIRHSIDALSGGVPRAHIVSPKDGSLLQELFTRDGSGLLISRDIYDGIRPACASDIPGIFEIIRPLEEEGILVKRTEAQLESEIHNFFVFTRDGLIIACAYLKRFSDTSAEIGCLAVHSKYRRGGRGEAMLGYLERIAVMSGISFIFVLSTRTMQWFQEHGFQECNVDDLPDGRKVAYNWKRKSKIYCKKLKGTRDIDNEELFWNIAA